VEDRLLRFQTHYERLATPFEWKFTRSDLASLLARIGDDFGLHSRRKVA
jgi:hypothetical protein